MSPAIAWAPPRSKSALRPARQGGRGGAVGFPHDIKGQGIYCYVTLNMGEEPSDELHAELRQQV